ncbi:hypothetical protein ASC95_08720 [Pelomonas sp. Root1217]|nr:hypothetical protein ASC95_08720 [Pelomonas sp. Root1217]
MLAIVAFGGAVYLYQMDNQLRGGALDDAMEAMLKRTDVDAAIVARAILENHRDTRQIAALWSSLYWGFAWGAAVLSALAGLVLKVESFIPEEKLKRDIAALLTVSAALLVTVSTSGDFQRKWQANRTAAAELERTGYAFLERNGEDPRAFLREVGNSLQKRHLAILGTTESRPPGAPASSTK